MPLRTQVSVSQNDYDVQTISIRSLKKSEMIHHKQLNLREKKTLCTK